MKAGQIDRPSSEQRNFRGLRNLAGEVVGELLQIVNRLPDLLDRKEAGSESDRLKHRRHAGAHDGEDVVRQGAEGGSKGALSSPRSRLRSGPERVTTSG